MPRSANVSRRKMGSTAKPDCLTKPSKSIPAPQETDFSHIVSQPVDIYVANQFIVRHVLQIVALSNAGHDLELRKRVRFE